MTGTTGSLEASDAAAAAVAVAPRVTLDDINKTIAGEAYFTAGEACSALGIPAMEGLNILTICLLTMRNGFTVVGKSAPASPANFNLELGRKFAREDAVRQLWPLLGYALCDKQAGA
jgi:hypothetical protein